MLAGIVAEQVEQYVEMVLRSRQAVVVVRGRKRPQLQGCPGLAGIETVDPKPAALVLGGKQFRHCHEPALADLVSVPEGAGLVIDEKHDRTRFGLDEQRQTGPGQKIRGMQVYLLDLVPGFGVAMRKRGRCPQQCGGMHEAVEMTEFTLDVVGQVEIVAFDSAFEISS